MNITINEKLQILDDSLNFILFTRTASNPNHHFSKGMPQESWKLIGYYRNVEHLMSALQKYSLDKKEQELLEQLPTLTNKLKQELTEQLLTLMKDSFQVIKIGENYRITKDTLNCILSKQKESDPEHHFSKGVPKKTWKVIGYFGKPEHLMSALIERTIKELRVTSLEEFVSKVTTLKTELFFELVNLKEQD